MVPPSDSTHALGDGEAEPGAVEVQTGGARAAIERLEHAPAIGSRDAGSAVAHAQRDARPSVAAARRRLDLDADEAPGFAVLERIADDVVERAAQRVGLGERSRGARGLPSVDGEAFLVDGEAVVLDHAIDDRAEIDGLDRASATTGGGGAGEVEDLRHQRAEAVRLPFDQTAVAADLLRLAHHAVGQVVGCRRDRRERRAQLVGDAGDQLHLAARQALSAARREQEQRRGSTQQRDHREADAEVAAAQARHRGVERSFTSGQDQRPRAGVGGPAAPTRAAAAGAGSRQRRAARALEAVPRLGLVEERLEPLRSQLRVEAQAEHRTDGDVAIGMARSIVERAGGEHRIAAPAAIEHPGIGLLILGAEV